MSESLLGKILDGRYEIIQKLATGGFGQTYVAQDNRRPGNPKCVVKLLQPASNDLNFLENARRLFNTEAETLERLGSHKQVPRLLAYFEEAGDFYLVQEYIEGSLLTAELASGECWKLTAIVELMREALQILHFLHSHDVIHRDIKPDNIIRRSDGSLVLVDFGTVKQVRNRVAVMGPATATISIGTPGYMPTEQSHGKPRLSSDIYALGVIVVQAMTGLTPNQLEEDEETGEFIWQPQADFDAELIEIVNKMVRYHFRDRYRSAAAVIQALEAYIATQPELSQTLTPALPLSGGASGDNSSDDISKEAADNAQVAAFPQPVNYQSGNKKARIRPAVIKPPTELNLMAAETHSEEASPAIADGSAFSQATVSQATVPQDSAEAGNSEKISSEEAQKDSIVRLLGPYFRLGLSRRRRMQVALMGFAALSMGLGGRWLVQERSVLSQSGDLLRQGQRFYTERAYEDCVATAKTVSRRHVRVYGRAQDLMGACWFAQAQEMAQESRFKEAIALSRKISPDMADYATAQKYIPEWSKDIFETALNNYNAGQYEDAKSIIKAVPRAAGMANAVQQKLKDWEKEQQQNEQILTNAKKALAASDWQSAIAEAQKVTLSSNLLAENHPYWQENAKPIVQRAEKELVALEQRQQQWAEEAAAFRAAITSAYVKPEQTQELDAAPKAYEPLSTAPIHSPPPSSYSPAYSPLTSHLSTPSSPIPATSPSLEIAVPSPPPSFASNALEIGRWETEQR
ncbi:MAG: serine/threonine-protein kinase [Cyanobacteria bacterium P01_D01_bin.105]